MPLNLHTDLEAAHLHRTRHSPPTILEALARGARKFIYEYFFTGLWRYGEQEIMIAIMSGYSRLMDHAKLSERIRAQRRHGVWMERDHKFFNSLRLENQTDVEDGKG